MGNENQMDPPDERKAWTEPRLVRLDIGLEDVEVAKNGCRSETDPSSGPFARKRHHVVGNVDFSPVGP